MRGLWLFIVWSIILLPCCSLAQPTQKTQADRWTAKAEGLSASGNFDSAVYYFKKAKDLRVQHQQWQHAVSLLNQLITNHTNREDYAAAEAALEEALGLVASKEITDAPTLCHLYNEAGVLHYSVGNYELAIQEMKRSLAGLGESDLVPLATRHSNIGTILNRLGDYDEAILHFNSALALCNRIAPASQDVADAHVSLSVAHYRRRNYHQAIAHSQLSLQIYDRLNKPELAPDYINCYNAMAVSYAALGEHTTALEFLNRALQRQRTSEYMIARTHHNLGYVYLLMNNHPQALRYLRLSIRENRAKYGDNHPDIGKAYRHLGVVSAARGDYDSALHHYQHALTILVPGFKNTGITTNPTLTAGIGTKPDILRTLHDKGKALYHRATTRKGDTDYLKAAHQNYQTALELLDLMRGEYELEDSRKFINEDAMPVYAQAMQVAMALYNRQNNDPQYLEAAFSISERSRALMLLESLQYRESQAVLGVPDSLLLQEKTLKRHMAYYENRVADATAKNDSAALTRNKEYLANSQHAYRKMTDLFKTQYPAYYNSKFISPVSLETLQKHLSGETALLEYFVGDEHIYGIVATQTQRLGYTIPKPAALDSLLWQYRRSISDIAWILSQPREARLLYVNTAHVLHDLLIQPIKADMPAPIDHLVIVAQGGLDQISFDALLTGIVNKQSNNYKDLPYLFRQYTLQHAYSATAYQKLKRESNVKSKFTRPSCLAFAPGFAGNTGDTAPVLLSTLRGGQSALPGTQKEIDRIAKYFDGKLYRGPQATETNFKNEADAYPIIHLATHGLANYDMPGRSHLLFADQNSNTAEDDTLYAYEIANLSLKAELVVLSGCETGFGVISNGEGIMSLGRSFIHAGSKSVLTSLWKVDDDASATLMSQFYAALADGQSKSQAMNNAREAYLAQADEFKAHPFFWAAFTFNGDDSAVNHPTSVLTYVLYTLAAVAMVIFLFITIRKTLKFNRA
jgi:CHAT domain-containing protein